MSLQQKQTFGLSDHVRQRLHYDNKQRCIEREIISDAILHGERTEDNEDNVKAIIYSVCGVTFRIPVDVSNESVLTAYPVKLDEMEAIKSNRWTQTQIESLRERVRSGKTEMI